MIWLIALGVTSAVVAGFTLADGPSTSRLAVMRREHDRSGARHPGADADVGALVVRGLAVLGCIGLGWVVVTGPLGAAAGAGAGVAVWLALARLESPQTVRRRRAMEARFALVLDLLAGVVEAGAPLRNAVGDVADVIGAPDREPLDAVAAACRIGCTDAEAWHTLADDPLWGEVARELARSVESGTASARILRTQSDQARRARAAQLLTRARAVGVKSSLPLMACFLPAFLLVGVVPIIGGLVGSYLP